VNNWTDELLDLMCEKLAERKQREIGETKQPSERSVPIEALSAMSNGMIKVEKHGN